MSEVIRVGIAKFGCLGIIPVIEYLLDERAERKDIRTYVAGSGSKLDPEICTEIANAILNFKPHIALALSPNAALPGPTKGRSILKEAGIPTIVISDKPAKKIREKLEAEGFGYMIIEAESMIGARREFLDPTEMALYNSDLLRVLAITGVFNLVIREIDRVIEDLKTGNSLTLPKLVINREKALEASGLTNPYAKCKAMAAHEISSRVSDLTIEGCFVIKEMEKYIPIVASAHEMMRIAAKLADEAREIEKGIDSVFRMPHHPKGMLLKKWKLIEKPLKPNS